MTSCGTEKPCCLPLKKQLVPRVIHLVALGIREYLFYESASLQTLHVYIMVSTGFMCGTTVLDKDGVSAAMVCAEMATYLANQGLTMSQQLEKIYEK